MKNKTITISSVTIATIIRLLRNYKQIKEDCIDLPGLCFETDETIDSLMAQFGLCWGDYALFSMALHATDRCTEKDIETYIELMEVT